MGFLKPDLPQEDPREFIAKPYLERIRILSQHWVEHGFGSPRGVHCIYILKLVFLYALGGLLVVSATSGLGSLAEVGRWWDEPVVYQKLILWTAFLEVVGLAGSWGPLAGHFRPMTGGALYWLRPGTLRLPPWPGKVPGTAGDTRTVLDVALYVALLAAFVTALVLPGEPSDSLTRALPGAQGGLVRADLLLAVVALLGVCGLRDRLVFLGARSEQYLPAILFCAVLGFADMIIALKLLIVVVWVGAGVSKFGKHFTLVIPPMISNMPVPLPKALRRAHYRESPGDLRPSSLAWFMAHITGTGVELAVPLVLLFSPDPTVTLLAAASMVIFHAFIILTFPLAVPLEWNVLFGFASVFLFVGFPAQDGYSVLDFSQGWMLPVLVVALCFFPVLGNLRPDLVSFLPSLRQYAGNWASATWALAPGCEERLAELPGPARNHVDQLQNMACGLMGYAPDESEMLLQKTIGWRAMHSQGRGLNSLLQRHLPDLDTRTVREAEFICNMLTGWNFGDGHLHDERLIAAVQKRLGFAPGELLVVFCESQPIHKDTQEYRVIDAALGVVERGTWKVSDAVAQQPWLPDGPIPLQVTWTHPEYTVPVAAASRATTAEAAPAES
ncbi:DUF3556 domain-containing protein [Streptomyces sp. FZ201]|uniref:DUF3556 domain-containing protein n=1 Tax=Streptomyces sp. FZ201 TaxID=3057122 RepID=UPI0021C042B2|nr:DUF3556 domain-containing protein [Streptomyces sp. FZ201]